MNNKGFTLIELLVVVAIIGILAAVGVVAYSGYTSGAKAANTKAIHKEYVSYTSSQVKLCEIGQDKIFPSKARPYPDGLLNCSQINASNVEGNSISYFYESQFVNPYDKKTAVRSSAPWVGGFSDNDVGYVNVNTLSQNKVIYVYTCFKTPCNNSDNVLIGSIEVIN